MTEMQTEYGRVVPEHRREVLKERWKFDGYDTYTSQETLEDLTSLRVEHINMYRAACMRIRELEDELKRARA